MKITKVKQPLAGYYVKFYDMADEWTSRHKRELPLIRLKKAPRKKTRGSVKHFPPTIALWVDKDEVYSTYLFLHEFAHIVRGPVLPNEDSHDDQYLRTLSKLVTFFGFDKDYVIEQEAKYAVERRAAGEQF